MGSFSLSLSPSLPPSLPPPFPPSLSLSLSLSLFLSLSLPTAVRNGDLVRFSEVLEMFTDQFQKEKTFALIVRLRHNVIKTGIRTISLSYSRISLRDIAGKLQLDNPLDAEYIIAKVPLRGDDPM